MHVCSSWAIWPNIWRNCWRSEEEIAEADKRRKVFFNERELRFQPYADGFYVNMITDGIVACEKTGIYASAQDDKKRYERGVKEV